MIHIFRKKAEVFEKMLNYWNETLENIRKDSRNDKFKIIVNDHSYEVPLSYAL